MTLKTLVVVCLCILRIFANVSKSSLPERKICGLQNPSGYIHGGHASTTEEFPWLAYLSYDDSSTTRPFCSGSLVSDRYVVVAGECINSSTAAGTYVTLGKWTCNHKPNFEECIQLVQKFEAEAVIVHPNYDNATKANNVGLIKLNRAVIYSDSILPICLPLPNITEPPKLGEIVVAAGWGLFNDTEHDQNIKGQLLSSDECTRHLVENLPDLSENAHFICIVPLDNTTKFLCESPPTPLLFLHNSQWQLEGITHLRKPCSSNSPIAFTKVRPYLDWILENIRP